MKTYKYKFSNQCNTIRLGNLLDDMWQVHQYFHAWQNQRYQEGLPYANYNAMSDHLTKCKQTTHPHWKGLPSQAIQQELKRIDTAYQRFFKKLGGKPRIKPRHKFKSDNGLPQRNRVQIVATKTKIFLSMIGSGHAPNVGLTTIETSMLR